MSEFQGERADEVMWELELAGFERSPHPVVVSDRGIALEEKWLI